MIDPKLLRNELDAVVAKLERRGFSFDVKKIKFLENRRKILQIKTENLQAKRNSKSKLIGYIKHSKKEVNILCQEVQEITKNLDIIKIELLETQNQIQNFFLEFPNLPSDDVPFGQNEMHNKIIKIWGKPYQFNFKVKDHVELGKIIKGLNFTAAIKITGSRFVVMQGQIARLHRALTQFMIDLHSEKHGYCETYVPYLVNHDALIGTGQLPKFSSDLFHTIIYKEELNVCNYALIPTAEVPLTNLVRNEILEEEQLPIKLVAHTPCFRAESGSYGRDSRGLIRTHQFDKVELVQIVTPEFSVNALDELVGHAEKVLQLLKLPYRKVLLCTGDMGFSATKTYDLEVWFPSQNTYREISSCSNMDSFQARRMKTKYRDKICKKTHTVHTINGSGLAVGRTLAAVLENYQQIDHRIIVPEILHPYMNGLKFIG